jgi:hypothetical protein
MSTLRVANVTARLVLDVDPHAADLPGAWLITHGQGGPARGTYTEVVFAPGLLEAAEAGPYGAEVAAETAVRMVAASLYGDLWAFFYRPEQREKVITRWGLRRRERVLIEAAEVWAS